MYTNLKRKQTMEKTFEINSILNFDHYFRKKNSYIHIFIPIRSNQQTMITALAILLLRDWAAPGASSSSTGILSALQETCKMFGYGYLLIYITAVYVTIMYVFVKEICSNHFITIQSMFLCIQLVASHIWAHLVVVVRKVCFELLCIL